MRRRIGLGWMLGVVLLPLLVEATSVTGMAGAATALQGESQTWGYWGVIIALAVGVLGYALSGINHQFTAIFGWVLLVMGAGAFIASAIPIISLAGLAPGAVPGVAPVGSAFGQLGGLLFAGPLVGLVVQVVRDVRR